VRGGGISRSSLELANVLRLVPHPHTAAVRFKGSMREKFRGILSRERENRRAFLEILKLAGVAAAMKSPCNNHQPTGNYLA